MDNPQPDLSAIITRALAADSFDEAKAILREAVPETREERALRRAAELWRADFYSISAPRLILTIAQTLVNEGVIRKETA